MTHALHARGLRKTLDNGRAVLDGVDLDLMSGSLVAVRGPRIATSTLVRCLSGAYRPLAGTVTLAGGGERLDLTKASPRDIAWIRRHHLSVFDGPANASPSEDAEAVVARIARCTADVARAALCRIGADDLTGRRYGTLRPDQRRLVALASALAKPAPVIVLDAPDEFADPALTASWMKERCETGAAILVTMTTNSQAGMDATAAGELHEGKLRWIA